MAANCKQAILIYPKQLREQLSVKIEEVRLHSLTFSLDGNLEQSGQTFLKALLNDS